MRYQTLSIDVLDRVVLAFLDKRTPAFQGRRP
jgi:hypothetical protein